tara:strand:- start:2744 stop:2854 length:111 start_codon:yes stop_codon:yes gene_type:complete
MKELTKEQEEYLMELKIIERDLVDLWEDLQYGDDEQ